MKAILRMLTCVFGLAGALAVPAQDGPVITQQPADATVCAGRDAVFHVEVTGDPPLTFMWLTNFVPYPGPFEFTATNSTLTLSNVQFFNDQTLVQVMINSPFGFTQSVTAVLRVPDPYVCDPPADQALPVGGMIQFEVTAEGTPPLSYQWWFERFASTDVHPLTNDVRVIGADMPNLTILNANPTDAGKYWVTVTNWLGSNATSRAALCSVGPPPTVTNVPSRIVRIHAATVFAPFYTGANPRTYQWYRNDIAIPGAINPNLNLANIQRPEVGLYHVVVSNPGGSATSAKAQLQVRISLEGTTPIFREEATDVLPSLTNAVVANFSPPPTAVFHGVPLLFSTYNATADAGEVHCGIPASHSMWVLYTSPRTELTRVSTEGSDFDTVLAVCTWNGNPNSPPTPVACDNNGGYDSLSSLVSFPAAMGQNYYIVVDGVGGANGIVRLQVGQNIRKLVWDRVKGDFRFEVAGPFWYENRLNTATSLGPMANWTTIVTMPATNRDWIIGYTNPAVAAEFTRFYSVTVHTNSVPP